MRRAMWIAAVAAGIAGAPPIARADSPPVHEHVAGVSAEWLPSGQTTYSGSQGEGNFDVDQAYGATAWIGWEPTPNFEIGGQVRYIAHEQLTGDTASGSELVTALRIAAHTRPSPTIDVAFLVMPGYSHVYMPASVPLPDATGFTVDFAGELSVPLDGSLYGVFTIGYQRGFQRTTDPSPFPGAGNIDAWATGYIHLGLGLAKRF